MIIQKLRQKRDILFGELEEDGTPSNILEKCCRNPTLYANGYYDDKADEIVKPFGWEKFQNACLEVQDAEIAEYEAALA